MRLNHLFSPFGTGLHCVSFRAARQYDERRISMNVHRFVQGGIKARMKGTYVRRVVRFPHGTIL